MFTAFGVFGNSFSYLLAVRLTNAGTATVMQCFQLVIIMVYTCIVTHRLPRRRELAGVILAFAGAFLIATGGDPSTLVIPPEGLAVGFISAVGAACMSIVPTKILPIYGSSIVTGSAMFASGVVISVFVRPWESVPAFDASGWIALAILIVVGSFLAYNLYMQGVKDIGSVRATGGDPSTLVIPPEGLAVGLISAVGAACMSIVPTKILPIYGSSIVTGSAMFASGVVTSVFVRPWESVPAFVASGWFALAILLVVGSFLAYNLYMQGVKDIGSVRASLIGTVEPVSATVTSALVLGTVFAPTDLIGFALIIMQGVKDIGSVRASLIGTVEPVSATVTSALVLGTVFAPTDLIGFALIIAMVFLTLPPSRARLCWAPCSPRPT